MTKWGRDDYDQRPPFDDVGELEPTFAIRAQDRAAPAALRAYARLASEAGADRALVLSVERHAARMEEWQERNGSKVPTL